MAHSIGIFLFPDVEELDWVGPYEVFATWAQWWADEVSVFTLSQSADLIRCAKGVRVQPDHTWDTAPAMDVLLYPGGFGTRAQLEDEQILGWVKKLASSEVLMTSVCTGSLVYAAAGLLDGRPATTHWSSLDLLATLGSGIEVRDEGRFVDDGNVITAAGVSAGIDMALHLVERLHSTERARQVRRFIQYDPAPPV